VCITPIPKSSTTYQPIDFWPISITPVQSLLKSNHGMSCCPEAHLPGITVPVSPPPSLNFTDQFAVRTTGSTNHNCTLINVVTSLRPPFRQTDITGAMMIVWRVRQKIITSVLCNIACNNYPQCNAHTHEQT